MRRDSKVRKKKNIIIDKAKSVMSIVNKHKYRQVRGVRFSTSGIRWEIHNKDDDIHWPSCPHMHAIEKPWKLDLYTGKYYNIKTGKLVGQIREKELKAIWKVKGVFEIILSERGRYSELRKANPKRYPELPELLLIPSEDTVRNKKVLNTSQEFVVESTKIGDSIIIQIKYSRVNRKINSIKMD